MEKNKRLRLYDRTPDNDIRYHGFLSYRGMRIIAWICLACSQIALILSIMANEATRQGIASASYSNWSQVLGEIGSAAVCFFLVANFALILQARERPWVIVLTHLGCAFAIFVVFFFVYYRYLYGIMHALVGDEAWTDLDALLNRFLKGKLAFNVFIDLFMCSSTYFFLIYKPKEMFLGKKLVGFRLFALLPLLYEVVWLIIGGLANGLGYFQIPILLYAIKPTKSILVYLAFVMVILFIKFRKQHFLKKGKSLEEYEAFLKTKANSLSFSIALAVILLLTALVDFILTMVVGVIYTGLAKDSIAPELDSATFLISYGISFVSSWGLTKSLSFLFAAPVIMLFSYTKTHSKESHIVDLVLPLFGIILIVLVYLEGALAIVSLVMSGKAA